MNKQTTLKKEEIMKTLKIALIAALVACTMVSLASANVDGFHKQPKKMVGITIERAIQNPGLVIAMYQQLNPGFLGNDQKIYRVNVTYQNTIYRISGTREQWKKFFSSKWKLVEVTKPAAIGSN